MREISFIKLSLLVLCIVFSCHVVQAQSSAFTYQGKLTDTSMPANGTYDFQFTLFDAVSGGNQIGLTVTNAAVQVTNGIFTVNLDYGSASFPGTDRFLEIGVRPGGNVNPRTVLAPRQLITSAPYSVKSLSADNATSATTATTATNAVSATNATTAVNFSGALAGDVTGTQSSTTVSGLRGKPVSGTAPTVGQVLKYNGATNQWEPAAESGSGGSLTGVTAGTGLSGGGTSGTVTVAIAPGGVTPTELGTNAVTTAKLADANVTNAKIADVAGGKITGSITSATIPGASVTGIVANATNAANAANATTAATATNAMSLGGVAAGQYVLTGDARLSDARNPLPGSPNYVQPNDSRLTDARNPLPNSGNYVQNATAQQAASNFNIAGNGTAGGTLSGNMVNSATNYQIAGNPVLSVAGTSNVFAGVRAGGNNTIGGYNSFFGNDAGISNTMGDHNSFFGVSAGFNNMTGSNNSFFGAIAGGNNTMGGSNSFFGFAAGQINTLGTNNSFFGYGAGSGNTIGDYNSFFGHRAGFSTLGTSNSFFGNDAGFSNMLGTNNTIVGNAADVGVRNLDHATALGADSIVSTSNTVVLGRSVDTVQVPGNLNVNGTLTGNFTIPASNINGVLAVAHGGTGLSAAGTSGNFLRSNGTGLTSSALTASDIPSGSASYIQNSTSPQASSNFNISGNGTTGGTLTGNLVNAATNYQIGGSRVLGVAGNTIPNSTTFMGILSGTSGDENSFFGSQAGDINTGDRNSFFGSRAGLVNTGSGNSFFGNVAGNNNTSGGTNSFFGSSVGLQNKTGGGNSFFGASAGTANKDGSNNSFFGGGAGSGNTTTSGISGNDNSFFGGGAGSSNTTGSSNTIIGVAANVGSNNLSFATALGAGAVVTTSNTIVLGRSAETTQIPGNVTASGKVGIGTTSPSAKLDVNGGNVALNDNLIQLRGAADTNHGVLYSSTVDGPEFRAFAGFRWTNGLNGANERMRLDSSGRLGIGTPAPDQLLTVNGNASKVGGGSWAVFSDERLKNIKGRFTNGLSVVMHLHPIRYEYKPDNALGLRGNGEYIGFSAQEVQRILPEAVSQSASGYLQINNDPILWTMLNAVKEQQAQIDAQEEQIKRQQSLIDDLKKIVCAKNAKAEVCKEKK